jgi:hypothetical protein
MAGKAAQRKAASEGGFPLADFRIWELDLCFPRMPASPDGNKARVPVESGTGRLAAGNFGTNLSSDCEDLRTGGTPLFLAWNAGERLGALKVDGITERTRVRGGFCETKWVGGAILRNELGHAGDFE